MLQLSQQRIDRVRAVLADCPPGVNEAAWVAQHCACTQAKALLLIQIVRNVHRGT